MSKKLTQQEFEDRVFESHQGNSDVSKAFYTGRTNNVTITCRKHNFTFQQAAGEHMSGQTSCEECYHDKRRSTRKAKDAQRPPNHKKCNSCLILKPFSCFVANDPGKDGLYSICRECCSTRAKTLRAIPEVRDTLNSANREYYSENSEAVKERTSAYAKVNRNIYNKATKEWNLRNPLYSKIKVSQRRAAKLNAIPYWCKDDEWEKFLLEEVYDLRDRMNALGKFKYNVDHIIPLQSNFVCGLHYSTNLAVITFEENMKKGNRYWPDMW